MKPVSVVLLLAPLWTSCMALVLPMDCSDIHNLDSSRRSGVYIIYPIEPASAVANTSSWTQVYCDMDSQGGGWTVFQRRMDGSLNFYRPWDQYKVGFGDAKKEYWLGLETLFRLTLRKNYELLVDMEDFSRNNSSARYSSFSIDPESNGYALNVSGFSDGGAGDALIYHSGAKFSTFDRDQDIAAGNCAKIFLGAFWYQNCHYTNPNGAYLWGFDDTLPYVGVVWYRWKGRNYSLKAISMKIRPVQ